MKTDKELAQELKSKMCGDREIDHGVADDFLINVLREAGYTELAETFDDLTVDFWYA